MKQMYSLLIAMVSFLLMAFAVVPGSSVMDTPDNSLAEDYSLDNLQSAEYGSPILGRLWKRAPMDRAAMVRFGKRAPMDRASMVRFGKRAPMDRSAMVRFGLFFSQILHFSLFGFGKRAPMDRSAMVRFGKRAPMDRTTMVRFGK